MTRDRAWRRWTAVEAQGVLDEWKRSGLSLTRFARQRGYGPARLQWWKGKLEVRSVTERPRMPRFVPADVAVPIAASAAWARTSSWIEIALPDGVRLRVSEGADAMAVGRLIAALREAAC